MTPKAIPVKDVQLALVTAKARKSGLVVDRFAAYTDCPLVGIDCDDALRGMKPYRVTPCHFLPVARGSMRRLLDRVRLHGGLSEVRRTWGTGYRELQREFSRATA